MANPPAPRRPLTAVERRNLENAQAAKETRAVILEAIEGRRLEIEAFLGTFGISYDLFLAGLVVFLSKQERDQPEFFVNLHMPSFLDALIRIAMNGLIADGKEAAIAAYHDKDIGQKVAQPMFMRDGFVKVLWRTGLVKSINDQTVTVHEYETGRFEYEEGDQGFVRHKMDLMRKDTDPVAAAYCVIELLSGGVMREVVPKDELDKMAKMSKSPARQSWQHQMHRKGAIRRIMGKMPREKGIVQLLQHDDDTYLSKPREAEPGEEGGKPETSTLFGNKPVRAKRGAAPALEDRREVPMDMVDVGDKGELLQGADDHQGAPLMQRALDEGQGVDSEADDPPNDYILQAIITTKNGLQQYLPAQAELWFGDLQEKMKRTEGDARRAFWNKNKAHIEDAGRNGYGEYAMKLVSLARDLGLLGGDNHG